jgi:microcompartment protein CcmL/EutN
VAAASRIGKVESEVIIPRPSERLLLKFPLDPMGTTKK